VVIEVYAAHRDIGPGSHGLYPHAKSVRNEEASNVPFESSSRVLELPEKRVVLVPWDFFILRHENSLAGIQP